jgi:hypothetical protein
MGYAVVFFSLSLFVFFKIHTLIIVFRICTVAMNLYTNAALCLGRWTKQVIE